MSGKWYLLAAGLLLAACSVEPAQPEPGSKKTIVACLDGTKVAFDNYKLSWEPEDKIYVCGQQYGHDGEFSFVEELSGGRAIFEGEDSCEDGNHFACWPVESVSYGDSEGIHVYFYREQTASAGAVDPSHLLLFAEGTTELHFRPAVGLLKFSVKKPDITYLIVETVKPLPIAINSQTTNGGQISSDGKLFFNYGKTDWMIFYPEEGHFVPGEPYYIAFPPGVYEGGIIFNFYNDDDNGAVKFSYNDLPVEAGKVTNMGEIDAEFGKEDFPQWIECDDPIGSQYSWEHSMYGMAVDDSFDLGSVVHIYPYTADQTVRYISMDERLIVSDDGIVSATAPVKSYVKIYAAANPSCARLVYFNFGGLHVDGIYYSLDADSNGALVTNSSYTSSRVSNSYSGTVVIPPSVTYNGTEYPVTDIYDYAFYHCPELVKVVLPEGLFKIHCSAFDGCTSLEELNIPSTLLDMPDVSSNSFVVDCSKLTITSLSEEFPVDEYGNLYQWSYRKELIWLCEKTTGTNVIREGTQYIGSGDGPLYNSFATAIKFPVSLTDDIWVNSFRGDFPNLEEIIVDFPTYEAFEKVFRNYRKDSEYTYVAGRFARLRNYYSDSPEPIRLSVPAAYASEYATAVADYGFSQVVTH